jgi:hypothetical protein
LNHNYLDNMNIENKINFILKNQIQFGF